MRSAVTRHTRIAVLVFAVLAGSGQALQAVHAAEHEDARKLLDSGQAAQALAKAQAFLNANPSDSRMLLLKGVILTEMGRRADAIAVFNQMTRLYPNLPEPYNNLAVLYAGSGDVEKAQDALNRAIRTNPSYAVAHENLGDLYATLASQAYSKALQLDGSNAAIKPKLNLISDLFSGTMPNLRKEPPPSVTSAAPAQPAPPVPPATPQAAVAPAAAPAAPAAAVVAPQPAAQPAPQANAAADAQKSQVEAAVRAWAAAWASKNVPAYLASYGAAFDTPRDMERKAWEAERRKRIEEKSKIEVSLDDLRISVNGDDATARFRQHYRADAVKANSSKTLLLKRSGERWLIVRETTGS